MVYEITPGTHPAVVDDDVDFWLTVDGAKHHCRVSRVALEDHFGDDKGLADDRLAAFERGKERILAAAEKKIGTGLIVIVMSRDLQRKPRRRL